ncbi:MAG: peptidylprolyl isomerase [Xanthomonadaceae bacterium]|nr:peptidylprolyl isomerase [Xanthomonadaceae bacterium]
MNLFLLLASLQAIYASPPLSSEVIIFHTNFGDIAFRLYPKDAPQTSQQILRLVKEGAYRGVEFFRVIPDFIVQTTEVKNSTINLLPVEATHLKHLPMTLSLAHQDNNPVSGRSSFSFILGQASHLNGKYTVFGEVIGGQGVLYSITTLPRVSGTEMPELRVVIEQTEVVNIRKYDSKKLKESPELTAEFNTKYARPASQMVSSAASGKMPKQNILYAFVFALLFLFGSVFMHMNKKPRAMMALVLLAILVLVYGLVEYSLSSSAFPVSWAGIALFLLVLVSLKVMSRFENL